MYSLDRRQNWRERLSGFQSMIEIQSGLSERSNFTQGEIFVLSLRKMNLACEWICRIIKCCCFKQVLTKCWNVFAILHPSLCVANITHSYFSRCFRIALTPNWRSGHLGSSQTVLVCLSAFRTLYVNLCAHRLSLPSSQKLSRNPTWSTSCCMRSVAGQQIVQCTFPYHKCHHKTNIHFFRCESFSR